ncbi:hypothetical protein N656DRAFT_776820 [Canariomyces notabilis]|uniref:Uncharacterized protein n=1 Tax=Canariomyces notabilis TaxID=2074819 RepID=A0AAN6THR8_9PEZI|nr:hypothetical protein N656DRAFT_776820 [Canariomyces arenarius]
MKWREIGGQHNVVPGVSWWMAVYCRARWELCCSCTDWSGRESRGMGNDGNQAMAQGWMASDPVMAITAMVCSTMVVMREFGRMCRRWRRWLENP